MKNYIILLSVFLFALYAQAQTKNTLNEKLGDVVLENKLPTTFNYKALITKDGEVVSNQNVSLAISLLDEQGNVFFTEEHVTKTANTGMVNLNVGTGTTKTGKLEKVDWNKGIFISVKADFGAGYQSLGSPVKMMAVPYALYAANAPLIRSNTTKEDDPIFQVQNSDGFPLFTVYEGGYVTMSVADETTTRRPRGGFAVKSFKDGDATPRLELADGRLDIYVDPMLRRPRGGFAVKSLVTSTREGENTEPKTLFSTNDKNTYFTLDKNAKGASFQLRSRCNDNVVMAFTKEGKIQTDKKVNDAIKQLPTATESTTFEVDWWEFTSPTTYLTMPYFTNLIRWRVPRVRINGNETAKYDIRIEDEPTAARLSDYLRVGRVKGRDFVKNKDTVDFGLVLSNNLVLDDNFVFPNGKIIVSSTEIPSLQKVIEFKAQKKASIPDKLALAQLNPPAAWLKGNNSFTTSIDAREIAQNANIYHLLMNANIQFEIQGQWAEALKVEIGEEARMNFLVHDMDKMLKLVGSEQTHKISVRLIFLDNISSPVSFDIDLYVMF